MIVVWLVFGCGWLLSGTHVLLREIRLLRRRRTCRPTVGQVVTVRSDRSTGQPLHRPTVAFPDAHGRTVRHETLNASHRPRMAPGDSVDLLVDPTDPSTVLVADRTVHVVNTAIGAVAVMIGAGMLLAVLVPSSHP